MYRTAASLLHAQGDCTSSSQADWSGFPGAAWRRRPPAPCYLRRQAAGYCSIVQRTVSCQYSPERSSSSGEQRRSPATDYPPQYDRDSYQYAPPPSGSWQQPPPPRPPPPGQGGPGGGNGGLRNLTKALIAAAFMGGLGTGVWFNNEVSFGPNNVASTEIIDRKTPNSEICMANGYSSMVFDQRIFLSFNPFNVYVTQPEVKPGCVLRRSNVSVLEKRQLVTRKEVDACNRNMNTFAFVGDLEGSPEVTCVYHSEDAENQFLRNPSLARLGDGDRPKPGKPLPPPRDPLP